MLLCDTAVCFLRADAFGSPNTQSIPPDVECAKTLTTSASLIHILILNASICLSLFVSDGGSQSSVDTETVCVGALAVGMRACMTHGMACSIEIPVFSNVSSNVARRN